MASSRFTRLESSEDVVEVMSPPEQGYYRSPSPIDQNAQSFFPYIDGTDYNGRGSMYTMNNFASQNRKQNTISSFASDSTLQNQDTERLIKQARWSQTSTVARRASSPFFTRLSHSFVGPWKHEIAVDSNTHPSTVREFWRSRQRRRILLNGLKKWLIPVSFSACLVGILWSYDHKSILTRHEKYTFNALVLGFSLCLGFAVVSGLKGYAELIRWRILASGYRDLHEFDLIMGLASQTNVLRLLWISRNKESWWPRRPNRVQIVCCLYLLLMVSLQIGVACLGLAYSIETSDDLVRTVLGKNVSIADLDSFAQYGNDKMVIDYNLQGGIANAYGISSQNYGVYTPKTDTDYGYLQTVYYSSESGNYYWYSFMDQCPAGDCTPSSYVVTVVTSRYVTASATCTMYGITSNQFAGTETNNITYIDNSGQQQTFYTTDVISPYTTTYYSNNEPNSTCGDRCTEIFVYNTGFNGSQQYSRVASQLFHCWNNVSEVWNVPNNTADKTSYELKDQQARVLAGAIGYSGIHYTDLPYQAKNYPALSPWSWDATSLTPEEVADKIMHFTIGAIAAMDQTGTRKYVIGKSPRIAQAVIVEWKWATIILSVIPGIQLIVLLCTVIWANGAVIKDNSHLAAARLLRPVVEKLGNRGCALTGREIAKILDGCRIVYGVRTPGQKGYDKYGGTEELNHLDVIEEGEGIGDTLVSSWRVGRGMPEGKYDGLPDREGEDREMTRTDKNEDEEADLLVGRRIQRPKV